jgi:hypothetical protein
MRYFISLFFVLVSNNYCSGQNEKLNLSSVINSILLSQNCSLKNKNEKLYFFTREDKDLLGILNFDSYNSNELQIVYGDDRKNISHELKKVEFGYVIYIKIIKRDEDELILSVDLPKTNYKLYRKNQFRVTLADSWWDMHYTLKESNWVITKMICNGF